jgi:hypothetical protein
MNQIFAYLFIATLNRLEADQFHLESELGVGRNDVACTTLAVSHLGRTLEDSLLHMYVWICMHTYAVY